MIAVICDGCKRSIDQNAWTGLTLRRTVSKFGEPDERHYCDVSCIPSGKP
jgi:hypothetical protein